MHGEELNARAAIRLLRLDDDSVLPAEGEPLPAGFILSAGKKRAERIEAIRGRNDTALLPLFLDGEPAAGEIELVDAPSSSESEMEQTAESILERLGEIDQNLIRRNLDFRLLAFLFSRKNKTLRPHLDPYSPGLYSYPLAEALSMQELDSDRWIQDLFEKGYLTEGVLVDRIRRCPKCDGAHINYVETCPSCDSIDIHQVPFIHCFTCGRVAPQEKFLTDSGLQCPFCHTKLRHIGSDYDRPLENYECRDCSHTFNEPKIACYCLLCGKRSTPEELVPRSFREYALSDKGFMAVRSGVTEEMYMLLDTLNYMKPEPFNYILDWMLRLAQRPPVDPFGLLVVSFPNLDELSATMGRHKSLQLFDALAKRLKELIRSTDISTRTSRHNLVLLLPKTPKTGAGIVASRIRDLREFTRQPDGTVLDIAVKLAGFPDDLRRGETAELLLERMQGE
jgi:GGDEF domain-containing protein